MIKKITKSFRFAFCITSTQQTGSNDWMYWSYWWKRRTIFSILDSLSKKLVINMSFLHLDFIDNFGWMSFFFSDLMWWYNKRCWEIPSCLYLIIFIVFVITIFKVVAISSQMDELQPALIVIISRRANGARKTAITWHVPDTKKVRLLAVKMARIWHCLSPMDQWEASI